MESSNAEQENQKQPNRVIRINLRTSIKSLLPFVDPISSKYGSLVVTDPSVKWVKYLNEKLKIPVTDKHIISTINSNGFKTPINKKIIDHIAKYKSEPKPDTVYAIHIQMNRSHIVKSSSPPAQTKRKTKAKKKITQIRIPRNNLRQKSPMTPVMPNLESEEAFLFKKPYPPCTPPRISNVKISRSPAQRPMSPDPFFNLIGENGNGPQPDDFDEDIDFQQQQNRHRNFDAQSQYSQCSLFSQDDDVPYNGTNVPYDKGVDPKEMIVERMNKTLSNSHLMRIKTEIDKLKAQGKWLKITSYIPQISNILAAVLFSDKNFPK